MLRFEDPRDAILADRCIRPLCFAAPGDEYYGLDMIDWTFGSALIQRRLCLGLQGSSVLFTYRDANFVVFTSHQIALIRGETLEEFRERMGLLFVVMDDGRDSTSIPLNGFLFALADYGEDEADFVIGLVETEMLTPYSREQFFPVDRGSLGRPSDEALAAGFPSRRQRMLMEADGMQIVPVCKSGQIETRDACGVMRYPIDSEPLDGMSGGAVFIVRLTDDSQGFEICLEGLVQRGGGGYVRYLGIERILDRIDHHFVSRASVGPVGRPFPDP